MIRMKSYSTVLSILAVVIAVAPSCSDGEDRQDQEAYEQEEGHDEAAEGLLELSPEKVAAIGITTDTVELGRLTGLLVSTGEVDFEQDRLVHVSPRISGRVHRVFAGLGDPVREGQVLVILDSIELGRAKSEFLQARAREDLARQNHEREEGLYADRISSEQEMLSAKSAHLEAVAVRRNTEEVLHLYGLSEKEVGSLGIDSSGASLYPVRAPLTGKVVEKHVTVGELVTPERQMFTIADLDRVWVWIDVYERDIRFVHLDDDVEVEVDAYPGEVFRGKVSYVGDQVDAATRTVRARLDVDNDPQKLRPGMFARVSLSDPHAQEGDSASGTALLILESAVQRDGEQFFVFVRLSASRFERRDVEIGRKGRGSVEVRRGLAAGEEVVVEGAFLLKSEAAKETMGEGHGH